MGSIQKWPEACDGQIFEFEEEAGYGRVFAHICQNGPYTQLTQVKMWNRHFRAPVAADEVIFMSEDQKVLSSVQSEISRPRIKHKKQDKMAANGACVCFYKEIIPIFL